MEVKHITLFPQKNPYISQTLPNGMGIGCFNSRGILFYLCVFFDRCSYESKNGESSWNQSVLKADSQERLRIFL